jgi:hypothetical protein
VQDVDAFEGVFRVDVDGRFFFEPLVHATEIYLHQAG